MDNYIIYNSDSRCYENFHRGTQQFAYVVESFGKYKATLDAGFHFLVPFMERVAYKNNLKEVAYDVPPQECITSDNVSVEVDGILY